jgi:MoxR-like ATPase
MDEQVRPTDAEPKATDSTPATFAPDDLQLADRLAAAYRRVREQLGTVIVGQDEVVEQLLIALLANGHCILEGVPGLAKTLMISSLARCLDLRFSRIQFTPDLMPSDITGTDVIQEDRATGARDFKFLPGPIFANVVLADEINRTPPKTQAALLEAMQERQVTAAGTQHPLEPPFLVLATQNPIEQEGTYPLPEAQADRFLFKVYVRYQTYEEELAVAERTTSGEAPRVEPVLAAAEILEFQQLVRRVPAARDVTTHALDLVRASRPGEPDAAEFVAQSISWGAGPRAVQALLLGGKARALIHGRRHLAIEDVRALAHPVLRHRVLTNYSAQARGASVDSIIDDLLAHVDPHADGVNAHERYRKVLSS